MWRSSLAPLQSQEEMTPDMILTDCSFVKSLYETTLSLFIGIIRGKYDTSPKISLFDIIRSIIFIVVDFDGLEYLSINDELITRTDGSL
jgi:hypothetical protein